MDFRGRNFSPASRNVFSVVLLDMTMPLMSGAEALERILEVQPDAAVVLTSGYDESGVMNKVNGGRASGFLQRGASGAEDPPGILAL